MPVIRRRIRLGLDAFRRVDLQALLAEPLERRERPRARLNRIRRRNKIRRRVRHVGGRVRVHEGLLARVDGPGGDVDLLAHGDVEGLQERVHVLPAVELAEAAELRGHHGLEGVAGPVAVDELLDVRGLDFAAVVEDFAGWRDEDLG